MLVLFPAFIASVQLDVLGVGRMDVSFQGPLVFVGLVEKKMDNGLINIKHIFEFSPKKIS